MVEVAEHWPSYDTALEALTAGVGLWEASRLDAAQERYAQLDGELPRQVRRLGIIAVDGNEPPEDFSLLRLYAGQNAAPGSLGVLLLVNYEDKKPRPRTKELIATIRAQREKYQHLPAAMSVVGYQERRMDLIRSDDWDIASVHVLNNEITHPVVGLSNDADTTAMPPDYTIKMSQNQYAGEPAAVWGTPIAFDEPGGSELPMNRLLRYLNVGRRLYGRFLQAPVAYGGSLALTLDTYAIGGSWARPQTGSKPYGMGEPTNLLLNVYERLTGIVLTPGNAIPALQRCFNWVDSCLHVSPRRELYSFSRHLGDPHSMVEAFTTKTDNPVHLLSQADMARLAASVSAEDPRFTQHLNAFDEAWIGSLPDDARDDVQQVLRQARQDLGLPF